MGVQGLTSLLLDHQRVYRDRKLRCSRLVVDGSNLVHRLYYGSGLDQNLGGDYAGLEELLERFVAALRSCRIDPYVLLDGSSDPSDKKRTTIVQRFRDRIRRAHDAALSGTHQDILPPNATRVFRQTLARLGVPLAQCYAEADREIAALAAAWRCPVLSDDSDFFIFQLPGGLLPGALFRWQEVGRGFVPCKSYHASSFCLYFGIQRPLLPAFAALAGNDYVKLQGVDWAEFGPSGRLERLLCWLRPFRRPHAALEEALSLLGEPGGKSSRAALMTALTAAVEEYRLDASALTWYFTHGTAPPLPRPHQQVAPSVPDWMLLPLTRARLTSDVLDVLQMRQMNLSVTVETGERPSANAASRPLRQLLYGLLLGAGRPLLVEERDRQGLQVKSIPVNPVLSGAARRLRLDSLHQAELSVRLQVLLDALGVSQATLSPLPPQLRLPLAVTCYWMHNAQPPPDLRLLEALLQGIATGGPAGSRNRCKMKPDPDATHAFNQWQICLKDGIYLNQLLNFPLPEPEVARLFQGPLVHRLLAAPLEGRKLKRLLRGRQARQAHRDHQDHQDHPDHPELYQLMLAAALRPHAQAPPPARAKAKARRRRSPTDLNVDLRRLRLVGDEEAAVEAGSAAWAEEELRLEERLTVRTRFKSRSRCNRCTRAQLGRKPECHGWDLL